MPREAQGQKVAEMNSRELQRAADDLDPRLVDEQLRELARDPRFAAVLAWLDRNNAAWQASVSQQRLADSHGKLAHAAGSLYAVSLLKNQLAALLEPKTESALQRPEE